MGRYGLRSSGDPPPVTAQHDHADGLESPGKLAQEIKALAKDNFRGPGRKLGLHPGTSANKPASPKKKTSSTQSASTRKPTAAGKKANSSKKSTLTEQNAQPTWVPKVPTTKVATKDEKPAVNIYGEEYMKPDCNQRLQQCIIFLSDEGPENQPQFKYKLKKLEKEIGENWPKWKREGKPEYQYDPGLYRKVTDMMAVQRARVDSGARRWFEETMFPQYPVAPSEASLEYPPAPEEEFALLAPPKEAPTAAPAKLAVHKMTKEEEEIYRKDPWHEEMPRPEVWHRKMPNLFPFGETPFMEAELSKQMSRDLGEDKVSAGNWLTSFFGKALGFFSATPSHPPYSVWTLPEVSNQEISDFQEMLTRAALEDEERKRKKAKSGKYVAGRARSASPQKKRKNAASRSASPSKRVRMAYVEDDDGGDILDDDGGDLYNMAGGNGY